MLRIVRNVIRHALVGCAIGIAGCSSIPTSGPSRAQIDESTQARDEAGTAPIQIVDITETIARKLFADRKQGDFSSLLGDDFRYREQLGVGDTIDVSIWEAPPATLFGVGQTSDSKAGATNAKVTVLPDQVIDGDGTITVPFVGQIKAVGRTPAELQRDIAGRLKNIAHDPQVLVKLSRNATSYVTIVGDVVRNDRMPLSARGERVLDALASAGGVRQAVDKITVQVTRGNLVASLPLASVIRDPRQNVPLRAGDVVTALFQPYSFMALGATGKNEEVNFEAQGITLAQALARSGGLQDARSDAQGVFVFRFEAADALNWPSTPVRTTADGRVPVVYRLNLRDPNAFFAAQDFMVDDKDLLYVSNAPVAELQKFLNLIFSVAYPVATTVQTYR